MAGIDTRLILAGAEVPNFAKTYYDAYDAGVKRNDEEQKRSAASALAGDLSAYNEAEHGPLPDYMKAKGHFAEAYEYGKQEADIAKAKAGISKDQAETHLKEFEIGGQVAQSLLQVPEGQLTGDYAIGHVADLGRQGLLRPEQVQGFQSKIRQTGNNEAAIRNALQQLQQQAVSSKDALANHLKEQDQAISMRGQDMTLHGQMRGQDMTNSLGRDRLVLDQENLNLTKEKNTFDRGLQSARFNLDSQKSEDKARPVVNQGAIDSIDTAIESLRTILQHPGRESGTGFSSIVPSVPGGDAAGFDARLETFKAQTFVPMVAQLKGMGALSDAEGKKLSAAVGALDPRMPEQEFLASAQDIMKELELKKRRALGDMSERGGDDGQAQAQRSDSWTPDNPQIAEKAAKLGITPEKYAAILRHKQGR